jgi:hypothetical protein
VDFSRSWKTGLAFAALLHKTDPHCLDYNAMSAAFPNQTLRTAFGVAETNFDIPQVRPPTNSRRFRRNNPRTRAIRSLSRATDLDG